MLFWRRICEKLQIDRSWMWFDINFLSNQLFLFISCFEVGTRPSFFVWWRVRRSRVSLHCPKWTFPRMQDFGPESPKILSFQGLISMIFDFLLPKPVESFSRHTSEVGNSLKWLVLDVRREKSWNMFVKFAQVKEFLEMAFWKTQNLHFSTYRPERCLKLKGKIKWVRRNQEIDLFHSQNLE